MTKDNNPTKNEPDEEARDEIVKELMESHGLDRDEAEKVKEIMEELGLDEEEAIELMDDL